MTLSVISAFDRNESSCTGSVGSGLLLPRPGCSPESGISPESIPDMESRKQALKLLCPIAQKAGGGWGDDNINRAIASIEYGEEWPPNRAQSSAYKLCLLDGFLKQETPN